MLDTRYSYLLIYVILLFGLSACNLGSALQDTATQINVADVTPQVSGKKATAIPTLKGKPPQTNAAKIIPAGQREKLTRLSALLGYRVTGLEGSALGKVSEYIINTCETYIIYFLVNPVSNLGVKPGRQLIIPFEAVTINSGTLDARHKTIGLYLAPAQVAGAPAFPKQLALLPVNAWEDAVRGYWSNIVRIGKLRSECGTMGIQKIAYSHQLLGAELKDFNHNLLGIVREAILEPESGKLGFYVVELKDSQKLVMVPLGKTNIPEAALQPGNPFELVLLTKNDVLLNAPQIASIDQASSAQTQKDAREYWGH